MTVPAEMIRNNTDWAIVRGGQVIWSVPVAEMDERAAVKAALAWATNWLIPLVVNGNKLSPLPPAEGRIQVVERYVAIYDQPPTRVGDVHLRITDVQSTSPWRSWWITEDAFNRALADGMTIDELDRLFRTAPRIRQTSAAYPLRYHHIPLLQDNIRRRARGEPDQSLWRWRTFYPTARSYVSAICRWDDDQGAWVDAEGRFVWDGRKR